MIGKSEMYVRGHEYLIVEHVVLFWTFLLSDIVLCICILYFILTISVHECVSSSCYSSHYTVPVQIIFLLLSDTVCMLFLNYYLFFKKAMVPWLILSCCTMAYLLFRMHSLYISAFVIKLLSAIVVPMSLYCRVMYLL